MEGEAAFYTMAGKTSTNSHAWLGQAERAALDKRKTAL
jgi:hypothetical protein